MSYAAILVHVQPAPSAEPVLNCARALAATFDATLIGLGVEMIPPLASGGYRGSVSIELLDVLRGEIDRNIATAKQRFDDAATGLAKPTAWLSGMDMPGPATARASRAADLIVVGAPPAKGLDTCRQVSAAELVVTSGRPVLVVPPAAETLSAKRILLAWKDTREARRAMTDALPFFQRAEAVRVLEVCAKDDHVDARSRTDDVAEALGRHGVKADAKFVDATGDDGLEILRQAKLMEADLIVAGGYGHSRLGEWVFGGVTRGLLGQDACHLLLSH